MTVGRLSEAQAHKAIKSLTWTLPTLVPFIRLTQDSPDIRQQMFIRDATTIAVGGVGFLATEAGFNRLANHLGWFKNAQGNRKLASFLLAMAGNLVYGSLGAPRLSVWLANRVNHANKPKTPPADTYVSFGETSSQSAVNPNLQLALRQPNDVFSHTFG